LTLPGSIRQCTTRPEITQGWGGTVTAGASLVRATENSTTFNGRWRWPAPRQRVDWLPPRTKEELSAIPERPDLTLKPH